MKKLSMLLVMVLVLSSLGFSVNVTRVTGRTVRAIDNLISEGDASINKITIEEMIANSIKGGVIIGVGDEEAPAFGKTNGWTFTEGASITGVSLNVAKTATITTDQSAKIAIPLTTGKKYRMQLDVATSNPIITANVTFKIGNIAGGSSYVSEASLSKNVYIRTFTPTSSMVYVSVENKSTVTNNIIINSLSIKEVGEIVLNDVSTSSVTVSTGNINIPITIKGVTYYIKANTAQ